MMDRTLLLTEGSFGRLLASQLQAEASPDALLFNVKCLGDDSWLRSNGDFSFDRKNALRLTSEAATALGYPDGVYILVPVSET